jgi:hypothetical protein
VTRISTIRRRIKASQPGDELALLIGRFIITHSIIDQELGFLLRDLVEPGTDARPIMSLGTKEKITRLRDNFSGLTLSEFEKISDQLNEMTDLRDLYAHGMFYGKRVASDMEWEPWLQAFRNRWKNKPVKLAASEIELQLNSFDDLWEKLNGLRRSKPLTPS